MMIYFFQIASLKNDIYEMVQPVLRGFGILIFIFGGNYYGEVLTEHCKYIFFTA